MLAQEVLESVASIPDPYVRAITYAKVGERLAKAREPAFREAFIRALETAKEVDDPLKMLRALVSVGYMMGRAGIRSYKRIFLQVSEDSALLPAKVRDEVMRSIALSLLRLGEIGEAVTYAVEIKDQRLRQETMVVIVRQVARSIERRPIRVAYSLRKIRLALEYITDEPYRSKALLELMKAFIALKSYENALATVREMGSKEWARQAFKELIYRLKAQGVLENYIGLIEELAGEMVERFGESFTRELATAFALSGKGDVAAELMERLGDEEETVELALELLRRYPRGLPSFIYALEPETSLPVGKAIMNAILERPERGDWGVIKAVVEKTGSEDILAKVARFYVLKGRVEEARKIGSALEDLHLRSVVMADVARHYLKEGDVDKAIDAALEVRDARYTSMLMSEILLKALDAELGGGEVGKTGESSEAKGG
ncbi:prenyltransferase [Thermococcus sp.]|uniref:prenyltransferase n=1 Tax=Thermococcus sp. TaxID=35749 RepID=UPI00260714D2|nr:prenyltransferase [Thermococcus sp.]